MHTKGMPDVVEARSAIFPSPMRNPAFPHQFPEIIVDRVDRIFAAFWGFKEIVVIHVDPVDHFRIIPAM
jgi:hypothetical protein